MNTIEIICGIIVILSSTINAISAFKHNEKNLCITFSAFAAILTGVVVAELIIR